MAKTTVTIRKTGTPLDLLTLTDRDLMRKIGLTIRERVIRRTLSGHDEDGGAFRPYSRRYAEQKGKALGGATTVNLQASGRMLQGIVVTAVSDDSVTLGFKD